MGCFASVLAFDLMRHRQVIVPALQQFLHDGTLGVELAPIFAKFYQSSKEAEYLHPNFYRHHPKISSQWEALRSGLGIGLFKDSACLDRDLGAKHANFSELATLQPQAWGGCQSTLCQSAKTCLFRRSNSHPISTETLMAFIQKLVLTSCPDPPPPLLLGRRFLFERVQEWYGQELGQESDAARQYFFNAKDPLCLYLTRLFKRGAIWGWANGGHGEGLLGWLNADESLLLAEALVAYDLSPNAPTPESLSTDSLEILSELRQALAALKAFALACGEQNLGILLRLD